MVKGKKSKKRPKKYEDKLFIKGTLDDVLEISIQKAKGKKKKPKKK